MNKALKVGMVYIFSIFFFILLVNANRIDRTYSRNEREYMLAAPLSDAETGDVSTEAPYPDQADMLGFVGKLLVVARQTAAKALTYTQDMSNAVDCAFKGINISNCSPNLLSTNFNEEIELTNEALDEITTYVPDEVKLPEELAEGAPEIKTVEEPNEIKDEQIEELTLAIKELREEIKQLKGILNESNSTNV